MTGGTQTCRKANRRNMGGMKGEREEERGGHVGVEQQNDRDPASNEELYFILF